MHVVTEIDPKTGALFARNRYNAEFADRVAFLDVSEPSRTVTGDRTEFLGRNGTPANPAAMRRARLSGRVGAGLDPCARDAGARSSWPTGRSAKSCSSSASAATSTRPASLVQRFRGVDRRAARARRRSGITGTARWARCNVETPDPSLNFLANGWLLYQTLACRLWGRSGYYQSGGAFGFRDQLQDVDGAGPRRAAACCASICCVPPRVSSAKGTCSTGGIRPAAAACARISPTTISGCRWRPAATSCGTGDTGVLDERIPFLEGRPVQARRGILLRPAQSLGRSRHALRALRARDQARPAASASTACR